MTNPADEKVSYLELELEKKRIAREQASLRPLSGAIEKLIKRLVPTHSRDAVDGLQSVRKLWAEVVGKGIAKHTLPVR